MYIRRPRISEESQTAGGRQREQVEGQEDTLMKKKKSWEARLGRKPLWAISWYDTVIMLLLAKRLLWVNCWCDVEMLLVNHCCDAVIMLQKRLIFVTKKYLCLFCNVSSLFGAVLTRITIRRLINYTAGKLTTIWSGVLFTFL